MALDPADIARTVQTREWRLRYYEAGSATRSSCSTAADRERPGGATSPGTSRRWPSTSTCTPSTCRAGAGPTPRRSTGSTTWTRPSSSWTPSASTGPRSSATPMGGQTSLRLATEHPDRISHLVTMGPPVGRTPDALGPGDGPSEGLKVLIEAYRDPSPENMRRLVEIMCFDKARFATPELCKAGSDAALARPEHLRNYVEGLPKGAPLPKWVKPELLPTIQAPTLLIHGRDDRVVSYETLAVPAGEHPQQPAGAARPMRPLGDDRARRRVQPAGHRLHHEQLTPSRPPGARRGAPRPRRASAPPTTARRGVRALGCAPGSPTPRRTSRCRSG